LKNYLSTPKFVVALTDISLALIHQTDRKQYLKEELTKLNQRLPASVYIPFVSSNVQHVLTNIYLDSIRNYTVLHIVIEEAKVFQTKERAPLLLCIEAYRPEELMLVRDMRMASNYLLSSERSNSWHSSIGN
jgi:hypothetical protein